MIIQTPSEKLHCSKWSKESGEDPPLIEIVFSEIWIDRWPDRALTIYNVYNIELFFFGFHKTQTLTSLQIFICEDISSNEFLYRILTQAVLKLVTTNLLVQYWNDPSAEFTVRMIAYIQVFMS